MISNFCSTKLVHLWIFKSVSFGSFIHIPLAALLRKKKAWQSKQTSQTSFVGWRERHFWCAEEHTFVFHKLYYIFVKTNFLRDRSLCWELFFLKWQYHLDIKGEVENWNQIIVLDLSLACEFCLLFTQTISDFTLRLCSYSLPFSVKNHAILASQTWTILCK